MEKRVLHTLIFISLLTFLFTGCATILKGYEEKVNLINAPNDIKVYSKDGIEIPVMSSRTQVFSEKTNQFELVELKSINLRTNQDHVLLLKSEGKEKLIKVYPRIKISWVILDFLMGVFPAFIDAHTGCWNGFQPIFIDL